MCLRMIISLAFIALLTSCASTQVISAQEMTLKNAPPAPVAAPVQVEWTGIWIELGTEAEIVAPKKGKIQGTEVTVSVSETGWSSFTTPKGESRSGWASLRFMQNGEMKSVRIDEDDYGFAFGYRIDVSYAYELWNERRSVYDPHVKFTLSKQTP